MKIGLIGCGYWGPNYIRTFSKIDGSNIEIVCDKDAKKLDLVKNKFPEWDFTTTSDLDHIWNDSGIEAVIIATPATTHFDLCKEALIHNKHVLVEKPLTTNLEEAIELSKRAEHMEKVLMPGHIFEYNSSIQEIKRVVSGIGSICYAYSQRTNNGPVRRDVGASWDLALHDVSIFNYIFDGMPLKVSAKGLRYLSKDVEDACFIQLEYSNCITVQIHCSWLYPRKVRTIDIIGSAGMLVFDELNTEEPIKVYNTEQEESTVYYEVGNPLLDECNEFINNVKTNNMKGSYLQRGIDCVRVLEAIQLSQKLNGAEVNL